MCVCVVVRRGGGGAGAAVLRATCLQIEIWDRDPGEFLGVCTSMP